MKTWDIWCEGFIVPEGHARAMFLGKAEGETLDEAVQNFVNTLPKEKATYYNRREDGTWTMWGCRIFDNLADASKAFG